MTDKIDIKKLAAKTWAEILVVVNQPGHDINAAWTIILSALTALRVEHTAEIARLEAGCAQCRAKHEEKVKGLSAENTELTDLCGELLRHWFDEIYPADVFDGSSGDPGAVKVVYFREKLRAVVGKAKGDKR